MVWTTLITGPGDPPNSIKLIDNYQKEVMTVVFPDEFEKLNWVDQFNQEKDSADRNTEKNHGTYISSLFFLLPTHFCCFS